ncbi:hypothetical protein P154DRAFT_569562 [Amniculicola lignicola CBS 123094]|uniref:Uncharacterized protein n=1 Tax=Amniculicola lignicola CBS 123094 TaxID=1392246 RepID=A0A6A5WYT6_9PLEO|nr:hypothetical protein P154DRAFT_569562 [Amniculicola lignicola CBS 123094]
MSDVETSVGEHAEISSLTKTCSTRHLHTVTTSWPQRWPVKHGIPTALRTPSRWKNNIANPGPSTVRVTTRHVSYDHHINYGLTTLQTRNSSSTKTPTSPVLTLSPSTSISTRPSRSGTTLSTTVTHDSSPHLTKPPPRHTNSVPVSRTLGWIATAVLVLYPHMARPAPIGRAHARGYQGGLGVKRFGRFADGMCFAVLLCWFLSSLASP